MVKSNENVEKVKTLLRTDHHLGIKMIAEELNVNKETTNLNMKIVLPKWSQRIY
jgi:Mn-dependent DtxR family transcriptional regulator